MNEGCTNLRAFKEKMGSQKLVTNAALRQMLLEEKLEDYLQNTSSQPTRPSESENDQIGLHRSASESSPLEWVLMAAPKARRVGDIVTNQEQRAANPGIVSGWKNLSERVKNWHILRDSCDEETKYDRSHDDIDIRGAIQHLENERCPSAPPTSASDNCTPGWFSNMGESRHEVSRRKSKSMSHGLTESGNNPLKKQNYYAAAGRCSSAPPASGGEEDYNDYTLSRSLHIDDQPHHTAEPASPRIVSCPIAPRAQRVSELTREESERHALVGYSSETQPGESSSGLFGQPRFSGDTPDADYDDEFCCAEDHNPLAMLGIRPDEFRNDTPHPHDHDHCSSADSTLRWVVPGYSPIIHGEAYVGYHEQQEESYQQMYNAGFGGISHSSTSTNTNGQYYQYDPQASRFPTRSVAVNEQATHGGQDRYDQFPTYRHHDYEPHIPLPTDPTMHPAVQAAYLEYLRVLAIHQNYPSYQPQPSPSGQVSWAPPNQQPIAREDDTRYHGVSYGRTYLDAVPEGEVLPGELIVGFASNRGCASD